MNRQASRRKYHYIYKITREDGKFYIGMHSTDDLDDGYFGSGTLLSKSIKKHGKEKHNKEILEFLPTREALKLREKELVNEELIGDKLCMNLRLGGEGGGGFSSEEHKQKFVSAGPRIHHEKMATDKEYAEAHSRKLSEAMLRRHATGTAKPIRTCFKWEGKKHTLETLAKMRKSKNVGESNSSFGTIWIMNDDKSLKVRKSELEEYLNKGFKLGRKIKM